MSTKFDAAKLKHMQANLVTHAHVKKGATADTPVPSLKVTSPDNISGVIRLDVMKVKPYERNPRTVDNEEALNIEVSIENIGLEQTLQVTRRPTEDFYVLARGGKTRLQALQKLALKNPAKWQQHDFIVVPYINEETLYASHMVENAVRAKMVLWDTAVGFMTMREMLGERIAHAPSTKEFLAYLKERGLATNESALAVYEMTVNDFKMLDSRYRIQLSYNDIRGTLRPLQQRLKNLWTKKLERAAELFDSVFQNKIALFSLPDDESKTVFSAKALTDFLLATLAVDFDFEPHNFAQALELHSQNPDYTLEQLRSPPVAAPQTSTSPASQPGTTVLVDSTAAPLVPPNTDSLPESPTLSEAELLDQRLKSEGLARLTQKLDNGGAAQGGGMEPQLPAFIHNPVINQDTSAKFAYGLTPLLPKTDAGMDPTTPGLAALQDPQSEFQGMTEADMAAARFNQAYLALALKAGLEGLTCQAAELPQGYYMELPEAGHLGDASTIGPIHVWWILTLVAESLVYIDSLPESSILRKAYADITTWDEALRDRLDNLDNMVMNELLIDLMVGNNEYRDEIMALFMTYHQWNAVRFLRTPQAQEGGKT